MDRLLALCALLSLVSTAAAAPPDPPAPVASPPAAAAAAATGTTATAARAGATAVPSEEAPLTYVMALPTNVTLIAWLPVDKAPDKVDLDLRVEVVLTKDCHDQIAGLLLRGKAVAEDGTWDVIIGRRSVGECDKKPVRVSGRQAIRVKLPDGAKREIAIGLERYALARAKGEVSWNGRGPEGDAPGAPPTGRPTALWAVELAEVKLEGGEARRLASDPETAVVRVDYKAARWPACAEAAPLGFVGVGDVASHFNLTRFELLARLALDKKCALGPGKAQSAPLLVRLGTRARELPITVSAKALKVQVAPAAAAAAVKK